MKKDIFNFEFTKDLKSVGEYDMPCVKKFLSKDLNCKFLIATPFNYAMTEQEANSKICHFYIDDYQFERIWRETKTYIPFLKQFNAIIGPDFSMYLNMPRVQQIYNNWRNKVLMAYFQNQEIKVIPNIQWSDEESFKYCFDGIEAGGLVSICSTGCHTKLSKKNFLNGYAKMVEVIKPDRILLIGVLPKELEQDSRIIKLDSFMEQRRKNGWKRS